MGFSAGAELAAAAAVLFDEFDKKNNDPSDPLAGITSRPDFVGIIYPGPSPFARNRTPPPIPRNVPPAFIVCGGLRRSRPRHVGHRIFQCHAGAARSQYRNAHLRQRPRIPAIRCPTAAGMSGGLTDRNFTPYGTWQYRFIDWFRDLGFLEKPGVETKAAKDIAAYLAKPAPGPGRGRGGR